MLNQSQRPAVYLGYGAKGAASAVLELAERLGAPAATTIQGKGVFPETHPLWLWNGFGTMAPSFVREVMEGADVLLALGCRFGEVATASYGLTPPRGLIHVDINREVFNKNFQARLAVESDAEAFLRELLPLLRKRGRDSSLEAAVAAGHRQVRETWLGERSRDKVTPGLFFESLQRAFPEAIYATDSGNGTFLAMEHLRLGGPGRFIGPIDYSCMGYSVPGAIGAKFANPGRDVVALAGDGALLMTGLELLTASAYGLGPVVCVLRDGELGQIVQFQRASLNRDTCGVLPPYSLEAFARAVNADYLSLARDGELEGVWERARESSRAGRPVLVDVAIDYTRKTYFTKGVLSTNFWRLPWGERVRMLARAAARRLAGAGETHARRP